MSDDRYLGLACCCVPRRYYMFVFAAGFMIYGILAMLYIALFRIALGPPMTPKHCSGHHCGDILTCEAVREASWHVREVVVILGGTVFGFWGCIGLYHGVPSELQLFMGFLAGLASLLVFLDLYDAAYILTCNAFPYRIVEQVLLWPIYNAPVTEAIKWQIEHSMESYPVDYLYRLTRIHIMSLFFAIEIPCIAILAYGAYCVSLIIEYNTQGVFGLGPNFSLKDWKARQKDLENMRENVALLQDKAAKTIDDVAWKPIEKVEKEAVDDLRVFTHAAPGATKFMKDEFHQVSMYVPGSEDLGEAFGAVGRELTSLPDKSFLNTG